MSRRDGEPSDDETDPYLTALEQIIARAEQQHGIVIESASIGIAHVDSGGVIVRANRYLSRMTGFFQAELIGMRWKDLITIEAPAERTLLDQLLEGLRSDYRHSASCRTFDGVGLPVEIYGALVRGPDDEPLFAVMLIHKLTAAGGPFDEGPSVL